MEKVYALTEDLSLMVLLDPEALSRVSAPQTPFKDRHNILVRHGLSKSFSGEGRVGHTGLSLQGLSFAEGRRRRHGLNSH
jgi:hypothetical protein